ncbi:MAG: replication initiator protein [Microviridae sp.]|nr:MAG: replication initiator protein [Microviridae sp.]
MACVYPIDCWISQKSNENKKYPITFNLSDANTDEPMQIPCGKCVGCAKQKSIEWGVRMYHEASLHAQNSFVTLTYNDENCPTGINKRDVQLFLKRLRKLCPLRYFACGEYGENTHRPHYHLAVFGQDFLGGAYRINDQLHGHEWMDKTWGLGQVAIAPLNLQTCMYVAGYVNKKIGDKETFNMMSTRPGIGHKWIDKYHDDIYRTGKICINGQEFQVPNRYLKWKPHDLEVIRQQKQDFMKNATPQQIWDRRIQLRGKEINIKAKLKQKVETI